MVIVVSLLRRREAKIAQLDLGGDLKAALLNQACLDRRDPSLALA
jgi:hypothetical protein